MIGEKEIQEAEDWIKIQLKEIDPNTKGITIFTYGTENYMVSGNMAKKIYDKVMPKLKKEFPNQVFLMLPFWIKLSSIKELKELDTIDR